MHASPANGVFNRQIFVTMIIFVALFFCNATKRRVQMEPFTLKAPRSWSISGTRSLMIPLGFHADRPVIASRVFLSAQQVGFWLAPFSPANPAPQARGCLNDQH